MYPFGVDYYPEHWPEERWPTDARLMQEAGFNVVRLAEFAWSRMEPEEGRFEFAWLDRAIALLAGHGMRVILGTPTASAPPWLMQNHRDIFRVDQNGQRQSYGNRRNYCPNHPTYHDYSRRIVERMAEHYRDNPNVIGWQIDNEFGQGDRCCCPVCQQGFHDWLRARYGSLDTLNAAWGTVFWSHEYSNWSQIPTPVETGGSPNPGLALDYYRFSSDSYVRYQQMQLDILRAKCPGAFITHNFMGFGFGQLNYYDLAAPLDFVAWDIYPRMQWTMAREVDPSSAALGHDTMRGLKRQAHWVMEQQAGPGGWEMVSVAPRPGELRLWAYQSIAHGADGIVFFRWRTFRYGTEEYWHGLLDHDGTPSRRYREIKQMGHELLAHGERIHGSTVKAEVAMLNSYDARWAFQIQVNNPGFSYPAHFQDLYRAFFHRNVPVDVVAPTAELAGYKLVLAPALHVVPPEIAANLERFVANGGTLLLTARSGVKDVANAVVNQRLPGPLAAISGVTVEEYDSPPTGDRHPLAFEVPALAGHSANAAAWADVLAPGSASVVARYTREFYAGRPAITLNETAGGGRVLYVGTLGEAGLFDTLAPWVLELAGVTPLLATPDGVEAATRWQDGQRLLFLLNHKDGEQTVSLDGTYRNPLDGEEVAGTVSLPPHGVAILTGSQG